MIKVSVIIPAYNTASYLPKCLDSVIAQTLKEIEIIIINDASSDNTQRIIDRYAAQDNRIVTLAHEHNKGQGAARNAGVEIAKGEYIGFVDSDDWIDKEMFATLYKKGLENNADVVIGGLKNIKNGRVVSVVKLGKEGMIERETALRSYLKYELLVGTACQKICRREFLLKNKILFPESVYREDLIHSFRVLYHAHKIFITKDVHYNYVSRDNSTMSKTTYKHIEGIKQAIEEAKRMLQKEGIFAELKNDFYSYFWLMEHHFQTMNIVLNSSYYDIFMGSPLLNYSYKAIRSGYPLQKPQGLGMKKHIIWIFLSNRVLFIFSYATLKLLKTIKNKF